MQRNIFSSGLTIISILLVTATSLKAELAPGVRLKIQNIERDADNTPEQQQQEPIPKKSRSRLAANSQRSMEYVQLGVQAHKSGDDAQAALYYYEALKLDKTNAYAYMGAAMLAGATKDGVICMKAAAMLFRDQDNAKGYKLATAWLRQYGIDNE
jgi:cytochrome c-type biogenesis protein CcmH/NrfG